MSAHARIAYVVHGTRLEPPRLLTGSRFRVLEAERAPYAAPHLPLEDELGRTAAEAPVERIAHRFSYRHLLLGEGPAAAVLADAASALEAAFPPDAQGFVEDLLGGRIIPALEARNLLPGRLAGFLRVERHVALVPFGGGLMTRGLSKLGRDEVAILCEEALLYAAAVALRRIVREVLLSGIAPAPGARGAAGGLAFLVSAASETEGPLAEALAAHAAHEAALAARLPEGFHAPTGLLAVDLLDAGGAPATAALLAAIPEAERPRLRPPPADAPESADAEEGEDAGGEPDASEEGAEAKAPAAEDRAEGEAGREDPEGGAAESGAPAGAGAPGAAGEPAAPAVRPAAEVFAPYAALEGEGADVVALLRGAGGTSRGGLAFTGQAEYAGALGAPTGEIVVCDPMTNLLLEPLPMRVAPGTYPAYVSLARFEDGDLRIAAAAVVLSSEPPARLERSYAFAVDSGSACFVDRALATALEASEERSQAAAEAIGEALGKGRVAVLGLRTKKRRPSDPDPSIIALQAGFGDGTYVTWIARDAGGAPVAVIAGFGVLAGDEAREGDRLAERREAGRRLIPATVVQLDTVLHMINMDRRMGNDYSDLAEVLAPDATLARGGLLGEDASGRDAVIASLAAQPLPDEMSFDVLVAESTPTEAFARFAWKSAPEKHIGIVRATFQGELVARLEVRASGE
jgi:hypothetical protein